MAKHLQTNGEATANASTDNRQSFDRHKNNEASGSVLIVAKCAWHEVSSFQSEPINRRICFSDTCITSPLLEWVNSSVAKINGSSHHGTEAEGRVEALCEKKLWYAQCGIQWGQRWTSHVSVPVFCLMTEVEWGEGKEKMPGEDGHRATWDLMGLTICPSSPDNMESFLANSFKKSGWAWSLPHDWWDIPLVDGAKERGRNWERVPMYIYVCYRQNYTGVSSSWKFRGRPQGGLKSEASFCQFVWTNQNVSWLVVVTANQDASLTEVVAANQSMRELSFPLLFGLEPCSSI